VFPLAFPLIASFGALSAVVLLTGRAEGWSEDASIFAMIGLCLIITYIAMRAADILVRLLGQTERRCRKNIRHTPSRACRAVHFFGIRGGFRQAFGLA
jgi:multiple antibiotic resistance protein